MLQVKDFFSKQFLVFLAAGAASASANFFSRFLFRPFLPYVASVVCAFSVGTALSFFLNRNFTFKATRDPIKVQGVRFAGAALGALMMAACVTGLGVRLYLVSNSSLFSLEQAESFFHLTAIGLNLVYSFWVMKYFALRA